jgi:nucleoside-diphosphate-sugar epimerase
MGPLPSDGYGLTKREMEERLRPLCQELGLGLDMVRPGIVYGPGGKGLIPDLVHDVSDRRIHRMGRGKNRLGLVFIEHLVDACVSLLDHPPSGEAFIAVDPDPPSLDELLSMFADATGQRLPFRRWGRREAQVRGLISMIMAKRTGRPTSVTKSRIPGLMADQWFDGSKLRKHLGNPDVWPLDECVRRTVDWTRSGTRPS